MSKTTSRIVAGAAVAGILGTLALSRATVQAATASANLSVSASVNARCSISAPSTLAFGVYDPVVDNLSTDLDADTTVSVACTKNSSGVWVGLDLGANASGSTRRMANGGERLAYELYSDAARTTVWGNVLATGVSYTPTSKDPVSISVYGRVPAGQDVGVGSYSDSVTATINF